MKTRSIFTCIILALTAVVYTGCKKEEKKPSKYSAASDNAAADNAFAGIWKQIGTVTDSSDAVRSSCATVTFSSWDTVTWPKTVTIDFGPTNCPGSDLNNRRGKITAVFTGPYLKSGTQITVTLTNYYHNDYYVQGTQTITNKGKNSAGNLVYNVVVNNATVTTPDGSKTSSWTTNQDREFIANGTGIWDDVYLIRGLANGVSAEGEAYSIITNTDLRINIGCPWIVSGNFTLKLDSYPNYPIVFDYGSGACDAAATATLNGTTYNIVMK
ncbi:MAG: hypothetical protein ACT4ON_15320 [Bacteroidota bacterium]